MGVSTAVAHVGVAGGVVVASHRLLRTRVVKRLLLSEPESLLFGLIASEDLIGPIWR